MKTFTFESAYEDFPEGGTRADMVIAPDRETALRLAAQQTLDDNEWRLEDRGQDSLKGFMEDDMSVHAEWGDLEGAACPNCTAHSTTDTGELLALCTIRICNACGYRWVPLGFHDETRKELERQATQAIEGLDQYERESLEESDGCKTCEASIESRVSLCDECGHNDEDDAEEESDESLQDKADQRYDSQ